MASSPFSVYFCGKVTAPPKGTADVHRDIKFSEPWREDREKRWIRMEEDCVVQGQVVNLTCRTDPGWVEEVYSGCAVVNVTKHHQYLHLAHRKMIHLIQIGHIKQN